MKFYRILHPRLVAIIGSGSFNRNEINFMAASWITPISEEPETIGFACYKEQYSTKLLLKYKQFSVNIVDDIKLIWRVGTTSGEKIDKVKEFGIKVSEGKALDVPIIENYLGYAECKTIKEVEVGETYFIIGEVVNWGAKDFDEYGYKSFWKVPLSKAGKAFVFPSKQLNFVE